MLMLMVSSFLCFRLLSFFSYVLKCADAHNLECVMLVSSFQTDPTW